MRIELSQKSLEIKTSLQKLVRDEIEKKALTNEQLAGRLGLLPVGVESLLSRQEWSLDTAFQVADAIGLRIHFSVTNE